MSRLIDEDQVFYCLSAYYHHRTPIQHDALRDALSRVPTADPIGHAHWERLEGDSRFMCSRCKSKETVPTCNGEPTVWEYCPNCGAKTDGGDAE